MKRVLDLISGNNKEENKKQPNDGKKMTTKSAKNSGTGTRRRLRRTKSSESTFSVSHTQPPEAMGSRLTPFGGSTQGLNIYDNCSYLILCPKHNKIAVSKEEKYDAVWLPFISLPLSRTWNDGCIDGAHIVLSEGNARLFAKLKANRPFTEAHCMHVFRLQLPQTQKFITRLTYFIKLDPNNSELKCCETSKRIHWLPLNSVMSGKVDHLWGPEVCEFSRLISGQILPNINEYSLDQAFFYSHSSRRNLEEEMLKSANITEKDVERLYGDFIEHCFPSFFLTINSFKDYMSKYGFEKCDSRLLLLFNAFNYNNNGFLSFHELMIGLASIEPMTKHAQSRVKFIFKYFDVDHDGFLSESEFRKMCHEISPKDNESALHQKVKVAMKTIGIKKQGIPFDLFFKAVGAKKFRGTSDLCRSSKPIFSQISRALATRNLKHSMSKASYAQIAGQRKYKGICKSCKERKYEFATHSVVLRLDGKGLDPKIVTQIEPKSRPKADSKVEPKDGSKLDGKPDSKSDEISSRKYSTEFVFNPKSVANYFLNEIRAFNNKKGTVADSKGLLDGTAEREGFVRQLETMCKEMEKIVSQEERCVKLNSPAFVIGDIHGNLEDLLTMEKVLWKSVPIVASNYVFLGDYVDRGKWGLECSIYVFALKLLAPNKFVLLRGNHEVRELQIRYSYKNECLQKYGDALGTKVFEMTNRVFDKLPVCAVIDEAIYCAHGGIPASVRDIEKINTGVNADLRNPEESPIAWEILWSDPAGAQQFAEAAELLQVKVENARGFLTNFKRGTAFFYGEEGVNNFLQNNSLTHIIRAHEVPAQGFQFKFGNKCVTIFSCSHYCGSNNEAACVHIDNEKLRIVRLDTVNNAPATDGGHLH